MDEVSTTIDACARRSIWELSFDKQNQVICLELNSHLDDDTCNDFCSQFPTSGYFEGEDGTHGSQFKFDNHYAL